MLYKTIFISQLPSGLLSWRYVLPCKDKRLSLHRSFWWSNAKRQLGALGIVLDLMKYVRWLLWSAWWRSYKVVSRFGKEVAITNNISVLKQFWVTLRLSLNWCINPLDVYRFGLYKKPGKSLDYVYDQETQAFHSWQSGRRTNTNQSLKLIQDKLLLGYKLTALGIPMPTVLHNIPSQSKKTFDYFLEGVDSVFCKTRSGNQGLGAFAAWRTSVGWSGRSFEGQDLEGTQAVEIAWKSLLGRDEALIQTLLTNHHQLAVLTDLNEVITIRYISMHKNGCFSCLSSTLEVPIDIEAKNNRITYGVLPIEPIAGNILPWPTLDFFSQENKTRQDKLFERVPDQSVIPHWQRLVELSHLAHQQLPDLATIAWDWVITPQGAVLLEGNAGWGTATPQILMGGFLSQIDKL